MNDTNREQSLSSGNRRFFSNISQNEVMRWEMFILGMVVGALLLATIQAYTGQGLPPGIQGNIPPYNQPAPGPVDTSRLTIREANSEGAANAPVTIYEFSDFQCPFCRRAFLNTIPQLKDYIAQGKVRFIYKQFAILGQESTWAAEASECAADQGKFQEYHDELFRQAGIAGSENVGAFTKDNLIQYARELKLDMGSFTSCIEGDLTLSRVNADYQEGQALQVSSTPTFFINKTRLVGAQAWPAFLAAINTELNP